jgi:adenine/guanine/hypoxanthine permease
MLSYLLINLFDGTGTLMALLQEPFLKKDPHKKSRVGKALIADGIATVFSSLVGSSSATSYTESIVGMKAGGRTGLTAVVIAILFAASLFLSPLAKTIPVYATSSALLFVGLLMAKKVCELKFTDITQSVPSLVTVLTIPFTMSIPTGIGMGIITLVIIKIATRRAKELNLLLIVLAVIFALSFLRKIY